MFLIAFPSVQPCEEGWLGMHESSDIFPLFVQVYFKICLRDYHLKIIRQIIIPIPRIVSMQFNLNLYG